VAVVQTTRTPPAEVEHSDGAWREPPEQHSSAARPLDGLPLEVANFVVQMPMVVSLVTPVAGHDLKSWAFRGGGKRAADD